MVRQINSWMHFLYCCSVGLLPGYWPGCPRGPSASRISSFIRANRNLRQRRGRTVKNVYNKQNFHKKERFWCSQSYNVCISCLHSNAQRVLTILVHLRLRHSSFQEQTHLPRYRTGQDSAGQKNSSPDPYTIWYGWVVDFLNSSFDKSK